MPEFYTIFARQIVFARICGATAPCMPLVSYAYVRRRD